GFPVAPEFLEPRQAVETEHPYCTLMYWRVAWRFLEPAPGVYDWDMVDAVLAEARRHNQTVYLRIANYGDNYDVPNWVRRELGPIADNMPGNSMVDHNHPAYVTNFTAFVKALAERYDGHPDLEAMDVAIAGKWGEDGGVTYLEPEPLHALLDAYIDGFTKTPMCMQPEWPTATNYARSRCPKMGWRVDCIGDMGMSGPDNFNHMINSYPFQLCESGLQDWWTTGPISFEACGTMQHWFNYGFDIDYIISESLKWHMSNFNNKSGRVPPEWASEVDYWQRKMGYRITPRRFTFGHEVKMHEPLLIRSWWENRGVAPPYYDYPICFRLVGATGAHIIKSGVKATEFLPGDHVISGRYQLPWQCKIGAYKLQIGVLDRVAGRANIHLGIEGETTDGWYDVGEVDVVDNPLW
ncbi:MAG: DUF4832 domain-containing protein, partial [Clostridia bacterium]|nr:DUF4832 domain-containing protein [Clostridia bacterium]